MPIGKWKDFKSCVKGIMKEKNISKERASAYCATIERKIKDAKKKEKWEMIETN